MAAAGVHSTSWSVAFNAERGGAIEKAILNSVGGLMQMTRIIVADEGLSEEINSMMNDLRTLVAVKGADSIALRIAQKVSVIPDAARLAEDMNLFSLAIKQGAINLVLSDQTEQLSNAFRSKWESLRPETVNSLFQTFRNLYRLSVAIMRRGVATAGQSTRGAGRA